MAEDAARGLPNLPLEDALQLVHLYAERGSPKEGGAAMARALLSAVIRRAVDRELQRAGQLRTPPRPTSTSVRRPRHLTKENSSLAGTPSEFVGAWVDQQQREQLAELAREQTAGKLADA
jgi:hypothetical protein